MMETSRTTKLEEEDLDILALRREALMSLIPKDKKRPTVNEPNLHNQFQRNQHPGSFNHSSPMSDHTPPYITGNGISPMGYGPSQRPYPSPLRQQMYNPMYQQPMHRPAFIPHRPPFVSRPPMMPAIQPHLNPNFISQHHQSPPAFIPGHDMPPMHVPSIPMDVDGDMPALPERNGNSFEPTPPLRLSPRSARFVEENNKALQRSRRRSFSPGRSRSRSPRRSRSRSPHYAKNRIAHIARKRTRSKSPEKAYTNKFNRKSRSPRNRRSKSPEKRVSPKFGDRRPRPKFNGNNRDRFPRPDNRRNLDRPDNQGQARGNDKDRESDGENKNDSAQTSKLPLPGTTGPLKEKREKTEQELEDELLASTDSEQSVKGDDDDLQMTLDEKELDFLDDDEEESENEGRFKSKASTSTAQQKKPMAATGNFKSSNYSNRNYEKPKNFNTNDRSYPRNDHKRNNYNDKDDKKREKKSPINIGRKDEKRFPSPIRQQKKVSPEGRHTPESKPPTKEPSQSSKIVILKKEKSLTKDEPKLQKVVNPTFRMTFKTIDSEEKKKDEEPKKDERVRLVRGSAISSVVEPAKTEKTEKTKSLEVKRPSIMKRLGPHAKEAKSKTAFWAKSQIVQILCENLLRDYSGGLERQRNAGSKLNRSCSQVKKRARNSKRKAKPQN